MQYASFGFTQVAFLTESESMVCAVSGSLRNQVLIFHTLLRNILEGSMVFRLHRLCIFLYR